MGKSITEIDPHFAGGRIQHTDLIWYNAEETPFSLHGLLPEKENGFFVRMPQKIADAVNEGVAALNRNTSGGRIRFATDADCVALHVKMPDEPIMPHITMLGQAGFDLYRGAPAAMHYAGSFIPTERHGGYESILPACGRLETYTIHMPLYAPVEEVWIGLPAGAALQAPAPYAADKPLLYYGSSITQGGCASRPGNMYSAILARRLGRDFCNLGFSGSARGERVMAEYLASLDPAVLVLDYDHNAPDADWLERTHAPLFHTFRRAHPLTPVVLVSMPEYTLGMPNWERRRRIVRATWERAVDGGDRHVYLVDGAHLFDGPDRDCCTVDGCHPNDLGFYRMANRIGDAIGTALAEREL